jgi:hypothetical protein
MVAGPRNKRNVLVSQADRLRGQVGQPAVGVGRGYVKHKDRSDYIDKQEQPERKNQLEFPGFKEFFQGWPYLSVEYY